MTTYTADAKKISPDAIRVIPPCAVHNNYGFVALRQSGDTFELVLTNPTAEFENFLSKAGFVKQGEPGSVTPEAPKGY